MMLRLLTAIACAALLAACSVESEVEINDALDAITQGNLKTTNHTVGLVNLIEGTQSFLAAFIANTPYLPALPIGRGQAGGVDYKRR